MIVITIIIPVYNESRTILKILKKISKLKLKKQLIVIDDGSTDDTRKKILYYKDKIDKILIHKKNLGKGAAIRSAQKYILGKYVVIQDGDLEYNPKDIVKMTKEAKKKNFLVIYGSRVLGKERYYNKNFTSISRVFFNHLLTIFSNLINKQSLTDAHTCYKLFNSKLFKKIILKENGFAFCPEITTKISNLKISISEVPISYNGRTYAEGKKISYFDGLRAIYALIKYKLF